jgi:hypothetical protein
MHGICRIQRRRSGGGSPVCAFVRSHSQLPSDWAFVPISDMHNRAPTLPEELRHAGRLTDPVKASANYALITAIIIALFVVAPQFIVAVGEPELPILVIILVPVAISLPSAIWMLLQPARRRPVFYLRAFRSDIQSTHLQRLLRAALGHKFRLCGIRPPRERVSWGSRLMLTAATGLRYLGSERFDLEASDANWMARLLASYADAHSAFIDVRDITPHVADEIRLTYLALGPERCIFITDPAKSDEEAHRTIADLLALSADQGGSFKLLPYQVGTPEMDVSFVRQAMELIRLTPEGFPKLDAALPFVAEKIPADRWKTPFWEKNWGQMLLGFVLLNVTVFILQLWITAISGKELIGMIPNYLLGLVIVFFFFRALIRSWKENAFSKQFRETTGEQHPRKHLRNSTALSGLWVFGILFITLGLLPALARAKERAVSIGCLNSLKQIGLGFRIWSLDHEDKFPFHIPTKDGGTLEFCDRDERGLDKNSFRHYQVMAAELNSPRILVCRADETKLVARDFSGLAASNVTYLIRSLPEVEESRPQEVLAVCPIHNNVVFADSSTARQAVKNRE